MTSKKKWPGRNCRTILLGLLIEDQVPKPVLAFVQSVPPDDVNVQFMALVLAVGVAVTVQPPSSAPPWMTIAAVPVVNEYCVTVGSVGIDQVPGRSPVPCSFSTVSHKSTLPSCVVAQVAIATFIWPIALTADAHFDFVT